jgi:hypothetical protein
MKAAPTQAGLPKYVSVERLAFPNHTHRTATKRTIATIFQGNADLETADEATPAQP